VLLLLAFIGARAQAQGTRARVVEGRVLQASDGARPVPVAGQWVVLHRVGSDRAAPLDSGRSGSDGRFRFRYAPSGDPDALYFLSARHAGIAYFSPPLRSDVVRGGDADLMVYDTTSDTTALRVQGRHLVLSAPRGAKREVAEVFEIENQGTRTIVARDSVTPLWSTVLPVQAESARVAPGDVTAGAVAFRNGRAEVFAPISPGIRQIVLTYLLPPKAFPLSAPMQRRVSVLEILLEEPRATVEGGRLAEIAAAPIDGRMFRRFLAQDVPASAVVKIGAPAPIEQNRSAMRVLATVVAVAMLLAIVVWFAWRRRQVAPSALRSPQSGTDRLIAELASLDARFERDAAPTAIARATYERERVALKERIARALAAENTPA
jgi:hypothetical protein